MKNFLKNKDMKKPSSRRHQFVVHMPYVLLHFLIKEKALNAYVETVLICNREKDIRSLLRISDLLDEPYNGALISPFIWINTKQGDDYWCNLNNLWYEQTCKQ